MPKKALDIANRYEQALTAILVGNNVVNIAASSLATILFTAYFGSAGAAISTVVMTILVLTFGEVLPKSYAKSHADKLALALGGILSKFTLLMTPFVLFFGLLSRAFTAKEETPSVTEDELKYIIDEIEEEGVLEEQESDLVISALQFDETSVSDILIPRVRMVALPSDATVEEAKQLFLNNHFSRFPVYEKDMDNIIGMITNKDFFRLMCGEFTELSEITQNVIYVPETKRISDILRDMQHAKTHLAIVVDQYGGTKAWSRWRTSSNSWWVRSTTRATKSFTSSRRRLPTRTPFWGRSASAMSVPHWTRRTLLQRFRKPTAPPSAAGSWNCWGTFPMPAKP
mgnify:CR=1 FL=1